MADHTPPPNPSRGLFLASMVACAGFALWSAAYTVDLATWAFEVIPLALVLAAFAALRHRFVLSDFAWVSLTAFFFVQCLGGRYTFAEVPFPTALADLLGLERNPFDRIGHFCQGFVPAILLREGLIRGRGMRPDGVTFALVTGCCLGFSALYELLEMAIVLVFYADVGPEWLGMQGDPWDAQWDMTTALTGAVLAQLLLVRPRRDGGGTRPAGVSDRGHG